MTDIVAVVEDVAAFLLIKLFLPLLFLIFAASPPLPRLGEERDGEWGLGLSQLAPVTISHPVDAKL